MSCAVETRDAWRFVCIAVIALSPLSCKCQLHFFGDEGDESDERHSALHLRLYGVQSVPP